MYNEAAAEQRRARNGFIVLGRQRDHPRWILEPQWSLITLPTSSLCGTFDNALGLLFNG